MSKIRPKMSVANRAKQFMPFAAVSGLEEALRRKREELLKEPRRELTEDARQAIDGTIAGLKPGDPVSVTLYRNGRYEAVVGVFEGVDPLKQVLRFSGIAAEFRDVDALESLTAQEKVEEEP